MVALTDAVLPAPMMPRLYKVAHDLSVCFSLVGFLLAPSAVWPNALRPLLGSMLCMLCRVVRVPLPGCARVRGGRARAAQQARAGSDGHG